ncbi:hypothetical protein [Algoriphagus antarcticus]|uniref:PepSY-like beta-lactamase-inhibitor n=1 Tax=Algoriphagus antarcticus TaxID=238540 RepID=A0A3E0DUM7_9BACT|nr:hypothetical protein [Algoriphagus antarcticus]REG88312.1 hypothetical protein C8N25_11090 [Algoriphagus antarcticus]
MKKQLAVLVVAISSILFACNEKKEYGDVTEDGIMDVDESTSLDGKTKAGTDSSMRLTDGTRIPVIIESTDSINLPQELLDVIEKTDDINPDSILVKRRFTENNITYYELEFRMKEGSNQTFIFDGEGKRKSVD